MGVPSSGGFSTAGRRALEAEEGFSATRYPDGAGKYSIGYGHQIRPGEEFDEPISRAFAVDLLTSDLEEEYIPAVRNGLEVEVSQSVFDALVLICYNIGTGGFLSSTFLRRINAGADWWSISGAWNRWKIPAELKGRRRRELRLAYEAKYYTSLYNALDGWPSALNAESDS